MYPLEGQSLALIALLLLSLLVFGPIFSPKVRSVLTRFGLWFLKEARKVAALAAQLLDKLIPRSKRNGNIPKFRVSLWYVLHVSVLLGWLFADKLAPSEPAAIAAGSANLVMAAWNFMFLFAALWALQEATEVMNGDKSWHRRTFKGDISTAHAPSLIAAAASFLLLELAVVAQFAQEWLGVSFIALRNTAEPIYIDYLLALLNALPFVSLFLSIPTYLGFPSVIDHLSYAAGAGTAIYKIVNSLGSFLIVGTVLGLLVQRETLKRMVKVLLNGRDSNRWKLMRLRYLFAPSLAKSEMRKAFNEADTDDVRIKAIALAMEKHSYGFPVHFLCRYNQLSPAVKADGAELIASFVDKKRYQFDQETLEDIFETVTKAYKAGALVAREDAQNVGRILLPCLERRVEDFGENSELRQATRKILIRKGVVLAIKSLMHSNSDDPTRARASALLLQFCVTDSFPEIMRCLKYMDMPLRIATLDKLLNLIATLNFSEDVMAEIVAEARNLVASRELGPECASPVAAILRAARSRQNGAKPSAEAA